MSLDELNKFFQSENRRKEDLENFALRLKEKEIIDQLNTLKIKKQKVSELKNYQEKELAELMNQFAQKKDIELKAKLEIDEIKKQMRMIQKVKLKAIDGDK